MMGFAPRITFDTSAHNQLVKDSSTAEAVLAGIKSGLFFRFAGLSIEELVATSDSDLRAKLLASCTQLQPEPMIAFIPKMS
jgi:hypothetical protein